MDLKLLREKHIHYIQRQLLNHSNHYMTMESSRAWFCFWELHSLRLLCHQPDPKLLRRVVTFLNTCETPDGGYSGSPGQLPHLATTYAAIMSLASIGSEEALQTIDRIKLRAFLEAMRLPNGSFSVHKGGESDIRAVYCAIASATLTGIAKENDPLFADTSSWIMRCQTYEGGFGAEPNGSEAHGGYTFCALASLFMLGKMHMLNCDQVLRWLVNRQTSHERGFQGRTNKLFDGCYSFWQAAPFSIIDYQLNREGRRPLFSLFDCEGLQKFVLGMCQDENGGLRDKPDKYPDPYHTCYVLSGLSIAQSYDRRRCHQSPPSSQKPSDELSNNSENDVKEEIVGGKDNLLAEINPIYNLCMPYFFQAKEFFSSIPVNLD